MTIPKRMTVIMPTITCPKRKNEPGSFQSNETPVESHSRLFCSHDTFWGFDFLDWTLQVFAPMWPSH